MSRDQAAPGLIAATRLALQEVAEILESYPHAVIAGGTVPFLLIPQDNDPHEGTVDIDIVLDLNQPGADTSMTLNDVLMQRLFQQDTKRPFRWTKGVSLGGENHIVLIELLSGGEPPVGGMKNILTEDVYVSIIKGMEVALENPVEVQIPGSPGHRVSVASIPAFFAMKAVALESREDTKKAKDAYDIVYCLRNYEGGVEVIADQYREALANPIVSSGFELLKSLFSSVEAIGPIAYSKGGADADQATLLAREAYERVRELVETLESARER